jgi:uncharacterized membrane protein
MDSNTKSKLAIVLGVVILVADLLWLYGSLAGYGGFAGRSMPYRNYTGNVSSAYPGFNGTRVALHGAGYSGFMGVVYGVVILVADLIWLYLELSATKSSAKKK